MPDYDVSVTDQVLPIFNPKSESPISFADFKRNFSDEIAFAQAMLHGAPDGAQLHCHYKGNQLKYINRETDQEIALVHTYVKIKNRLFVKIVRKRTIGKGGFGEVKSLFDVETEEQIVEKKAIDPARPLIENTIAHSHDGFIANVERLRHPLKWIDSSGVQLLGSNTLHFVSPEIIGRTAEISEKKQKTIHYFKYRGQNLNQFYGKYKDELTEVDCIKLASAIIDALRELHEASILHCDVKAENILICRNETTKEYKVSFCDFDYAVKTNEVARVLGTPKYAAPELLCRVILDDLNRERYARIWQRVVFKLINPTTRNGSQIQYSAQVDIFALGILFRNLFVEFLKKAEPFPQIKQLQSVFRLMHCYHPEGRASLPLMQLVMSEFLPARNLPNISVDNLLLLKNILMQLANNFAHDSPVAWPMIILLRQRVEAVVFSNPLDETTLKAALQTIENLMRFFVFLAPRFELSMHAEVLVQQFKAQQNIFKNQEVVTNDTINAYSAAAKTLFDHVNAVVRFVETHWDNPEFSRSVMNILDRFDQEKQQEKQFENFIPRVFFLILNLDSVRLFQYLNILQVWLKPKSQERDQLVMDLLLLLFRSFQSNNVSRTDLLAFTRFVVLEKGNIIEKSFFQAFSQENVNEIAPRIFSCLGRTQDILLIICRLFQHRPPLLPTPPTDFFATERQSARKENALIAVVIRHALERVIIVASGKTLSDEQGRLVRCIESQLIFFFMNPTCDLPTETTRNVIGDHVMKSMHSLLSRDSQGNYVNIPAFVDAVLKIATAKELSSAPAAMATAA